MLLFILQIEPLLLRLQRDLAGLHVGRDKVAVLDIAAVDSNTAALKTEQFIRF
jgi:hypothetical protein